MKTAELLNSKMLGVPENSFCHNWICKSFHHAKGSSEQKKGNTGAREGVDVVILIVLVVAVIMSRGQGEFLVLPNLRKPSKHSKKPKNT